MKERRKILGQLRFIGKAAPRPVEPNECCRDARRALAQEILGYGDVVLMVKKLREIAEEGSHE